MFSIAGSAWLLVFNQYLFIESSPHGDIAGLHTVSGITYGLFMTLFYFLPSWKTTLLSSISPMFFLVLHYYKEIGTEWRFGKAEGSVSVFYLLQLIIEFAFFILFVTLGSKRKEDRHQHLKSVFFRKYLTEPHIKFMNTKALDVVS